MDQHLSQNLQQSQKFILSPQIRQYLKLLQLPIMDLLQAVENELEANPILEDSAADKPEEGSPLPPENEAPVREKSREEIRPGESKNSFEQWDESFQGNYGDFEGTYEDPKDSQKKRDFQESLITRPEALSDYLVWQFQFLDLAEDQKKIAQEIIGNINEDGYLSASVEEIAKACQTSVEETARTLTHIQSLDPPGIAARNLQEALVIQLQKKLKEFEQPEEETPNLSKKACELALTIVTNHLPLLEKRDWNALAKVLAIDLEEIKKAAAIIGRLEPRPGRIFYAQESLAVIPDASFTFSEEEDAPYLIEIHDEAVPELRISPYYRRLLRSPKTDEKTKAFLREKLENAIHFLKAIQLRKSTLREITEKIVKAQPEFFEKGFAALRPLRLKDISGAIGIHESTVSRAIQGKYMATPQGVIPYKSFFSTRLESTGEEEESQKSIMEKIRALISAETPAHPLSDEEIMKKLTAEGIVIARRTVAKYRELLKILPSHFRRKR